uniref:Uncharacterized protein n=1 Tax=Aegilops tauschii TaxID=37682 RepID=M8C233_AEGTA
MNYSIRGVDSTDIVIGLHFVSPTFEPPNPELVEAAGQHRKPSTLPSIGETPTRHTLDACTRCVSTRSTITLPFTTSSESTSIMAAAAAGCCAVVSSGGGVAAGKAGTAKVVDQCLVLPLSMRPAGM